MVTINLMQDYINSKPNSTSENIKEPKFLDLEHLSNKKRVVTGIDSIKAKRAAEEYVANLPTPEEMNKYLIDNGKGELVLPDIEFTYPSGHKRIGFYLDGTLKENLDNSLIKSVAASWDGVFGVSGLEGCQPAGSKVLMADGEWKNIEDVKEGDLVLSPQEDGSYIYAKVLKTYKWFSKENYSINRLHGKKDLLFRCSSNHGLPISIRPETEKNNIIVYKDRIIKEFKAQEYFKRSESRRCRESLLTTFPIFNYLGRQNLDIEPYTLGVWLGDGCFTSSLSISNSLKDKEIMNEVIKYYPTSSIYKYKNKEHANYCYSKKSLLYIQLQKHGLRYKKSGTKFIPKEALLSNLEYRRKLLSGLIDTDGTLTTKGTYKITTKSKQLAEDIKNLVYSIGERANVIKVYVKTNTSINTYYRVSIYIKLYNLYCKLERKIKIINGKNILSNRVNINLKKINSGLVYGFLLDSNSHLYVTDNWCLSYNSGKTVFTSTVLKYLDSTFPGEPLNDGTTRRKCTRIVFTPDQFLDAVDNAKVGQAIQCDEAVLEFLAGDAATAVQKLLMKKMVTIRKKRLYIAFVIPSIFSFKKEMAVRRTVFWVHTYSRDRIERGSFKFYNYDSKRQLFMWGKKDDDQGAAPPNFLGSFTDTEGLFYDVDEYNRKKDKAIASLSMDNNKKKENNSLPFYKAKGQRDLLLLYLYKIVEGGPDGEKDLQELINIFNEMKENTNQKQKMTTYKFKDWLKSKFGEHLGISEPTMKKHLQNAIDFKSRPIDPLNKMLGELGLEKKEDGEENEQEEQDE